jgi:hypothetical protein
MRLAQVIDGFAEDARVVVLMNDLKAYGVGTGLFNE